MAGTGFRPIEGAVVFWSDYLRGIGQVVFGYSRPPGVESLATRATVAQTEKTA